MGSSLAMWSEYFPHGIVVGSRARDSELPKIRRLKPLTLCGKFRAWLLKFPAELREFQLQFCRVGSGGLQLKHSSPGRAETIPKMQETWYETGLMFQRKSPINMSSKAG